MTDYIGVNFEEIRCYGLKKKRSFVCGVQSGGDDESGDKNKCWSFFSLFLERERESI